MFCFPEDSSKKSKKEKKEKKVKKEKKEKKEKKQKKKDLDYSDDDDEYVKGGGASSDSDLEGENYTDEEKEAILKMFNTASIEDIQSMINISKPRVKNIIALRPFESFQDLVNSLLYIFFNLKQI